MKGRTHLQLGHQVQGSLACGGSAKITGTHRLLFSPKENTAMFTLLRNSESQFHQVTDPLKERLF